MEIHSKIITSVARQRLRPLGLKQKGTSRLWFDDHGWWVLGVEFQPHKSDQGTFLNIGACWLWDAQDYFSYDFTLGGQTRLSEFISFKDEAQFTEAITPLLNRTITEVSMYREKCGSVARVADLLEAKPTKTTWDFFHAGIANGLADRLDRARTHFQELIKEPANYDWQKRLKERVNHLSALLENQPEFYEAVRKAINESRLKLKLGFWDGHLNT